MTSGQSSTAESISPSNVDLTRPSVARVYDYYLGGTNNWAIDREFAERAITAFPIVKDLAKANRFFLQRAVRFLRSQGVDQFIDIGSGIPTEYNTHKVADEVESGSRVVYVDNEPVAVAHSNVILRETSDPGRHASIEADLRAPDDLINKVEGTGLIDIDKPVAVLFIAVLHVHQPDASGNDIGEQTIARYRQLLAPESFIALSHITDDGVPTHYADKLQEMQEMYGNAGSPIIIRTREQIRGLLGDFTPVPTDMCWSLQWGKEFARPTEPSVAISSPEESLVWAGIGQKN